MPVLGAIAELSLLTVSVMQQQPVRILNPYAPESLQNTVWQMLHPTEGAGDWCGTMRIAVSAAKQ